MNFYIPKFTFRGMSLGSWPNINPGLTTGSTLAKRFYYSFEYHEKTFGWHWLTIGLYRWTIEQLAAEVGYTPFHWIV